MTVRGKRKTGETTEAGELILTEVLQALADPVRLEIVRQLAEGEEVACGLFGIDMPKSSLSHHFTTLRKSGVITSESRGTLVMNRLRREALEAQFPGLLGVVLASLQRSRGADEGAEAGKQST